MTDTIFDHIDTRPSEEEIQSYKDLLVGDGKKFKDEEALARGKFESDRFIENLQRELQETRTELHSRLNMEDLVSKLGKQQSTTQPTSSTEQPLTPNPLVTPTSVDANEVATIVRNTMTQEQTRQAQDNNLGYVASQLKANWGDDWVSKLKKAGATLGMNEAQMDTLAKTAPKVLLASVMKQTTPVNNDSFVSPRSSVTGISTAPSSDKGWAAYEKLRKENPKEYYTSRVQLQLHRDTMAGKVVPPSN